MQSEVSRAPRQRFVSRTSHQNNNIQIEDLKKSEGELRMKKSLVITLVALFVVSMLAVGCKKEETTTDTAATDTSMTTSETMATETVATDTAATDTTVTTTGSTTMATDSSATGTTTTTTSATPATATHT
jgi:hypothetical protein